MAGFFGLGDFQKSGRGISKSSMGKSRFSLFFEIVWVRIWKLFAINFIYVLFCIPVITIGPATAGLTKVLKNYSIDKNAYVWSDFFEAFKKNFFRSLLLGIFDVLAFAGVTAGCYMYPRFAAATGNNLYYVIFALTLSAAIMFSIMNFYMYMMMVSTDLSMKNVIKNSLALTFLAPKQNLGTLFLSLAIIALCILLVFVNLQFLLFYLFFPASFIGFIVCYNCYPVVQKYVINPYYERRGEVNPELPDYEADPDMTVFEDMGGREKPVEIKKRKKGKTIS
ncbi:MAG: DUF624 domain-containing protein [Oscillospiraceae bacterium]|nr:DUF624 domain-containing protein [Oscillospiraceae bacterium]